MCGLGSTTNGLSERSVSHMSTYSRTLKVSEVQWLESWTQERWAQVPSTPWSWLDELGLVIVSQRKLPQETMRIKWRGRDKKKNHVHHHVHHHVFTSEKHKNAIKRSQFVFTCIYSPSYLKLCPFLIFYACEDMSKIRSHSSAVLCGEDTVTPLWLSVLWAVATLQHNMPLPGPLYPSAIALPIKKVKRTQFVAFPHFFCHSTSDFLVCFYCNWSLC